MKPGICRLCQQRKNLVESHFVAKSILKTLREESGGNPDPVVTDKRIAVQTSRQMKDELLCRECDNRFGQNGEEWVQNNMFTTAGFRIREALTRIAPARQNAEHATYCVANVAAIDMERLGYFALSLFWRAAVHSWRTAGSVSDRLEFGPYEEAMRGYLAGMERFPQDTVLFVVVWRGETPPRFVITPSEQGYAPREKRDFRAYIAYVPGIAFDLLIGKRIPEGLRQDCSYHNRLIHMNVHTDKNVVDMVRLMNSLSRRSEKLKQFLDGLGR
jgi:hypothetical protein